MTSENKYEICKSCEYYGISPLPMAKDKCQKCGCIMYIKTKINKSKCPIGKW